MGGVSKWSVLRDPELSELIPEAFGHVPEVKGGVLAHEAAHAWHASNGEIWSVMRDRGCFVEDPKRGRRLRALPPEHRWVHSQMALFKP